MKELEKEYKVNVGRLEGQSWYHVMQQFDDANLYQTSAYDMAGTGAKSFTHLILNRGSEIVAAAQVRLMRLPLIKKGIAYVLWGPMCRRDGVSISPEIFRQAIRALRNEFSVRRRLVLRIFPIAFQGQDDIINKILIDEGFSSYDDGKTHRTLIIDLSPSLQEMRTLLDQKWRNCLNRAEKNGLEVTEEEDDSFFDDITTIHLEMANRKGLSELSDVEHLKKVQRDLPPGYKLRVILCRLNGEIHAGAIFSAIGTSAVYLVGATSTSGLKSNGSYIIQWTFIKWLKENGFLYFDLNGINPETNPGTYHFKRGLAGKKGMDVEFLGKFQVTDDALSKLLVNGGESLVSGYKKILRKGRVLKNSAGKEGPSK